MNKFIVVNDKYSREGENILKDLKYLNIDKPEEIEIFQVYELESDVDGIERIFDNFTICEDISVFETDTSIRYRLLPGLFDENEEMVQELFKDFLKTDVKVHHSTILDLKGLSSSDLDRFKSYFINSIEKEIVPFTVLDYSIESSKGEDLAPVKGFREFGKKELEEFSVNYSMNIDDFVLVQDYFRSEERDPSVFELNVVDTYWSDHCRHTTFFTFLEKIDVTDNKYKDSIVEAIENYKRVREDVYGDNPRHISLMDLGTINSRYMRKLGKLDDHDKSDEINAPALHVKVDVDGVEEDWLLYFKNETHNHPTEIEPYGGAATCVGGAIRDPLSGRSYVHQAMRVTGSGDPRTDFDKTLEGKLPQRVIGLESMRGSSDYGNKYGLPTGFAREYYDEDFIAKRMEVGANLAATPLDHVVRISPAPSDVIILVGGKTGRDGLGAAVGSSMVHTEDSLTLQGSEVQKGNPTLERKIQRLFRKKNVTNLIKMCNDFGAGGLSVAVGELADGVEMYLDKVPQKYEGLDPSEIGLAESQERMAAVVAKEDADQFIKYAEEEDLEAVIVAEVNDSGYMTMKYDGEEVLRLSREFLDSNGASRSQSVMIHSDEISEIFKDNRPILNQLSDINNGSQKSIGQNFDSTVGKNTVLLPYGGKTRITEQLGMATKIPVETGETKTTSVMTMSYNPLIGKKSTFHGGFYAVAESVAKAVALGVNKSEIRLTLQEYFQSLGDDMNKWGKPTGALLGAFTVMEYLDIAAVGGKDSMSGSFEDLHVPPTLISFAVGTTDVDNIVSRELKNTDSKILLIKPDINSNDLIDKDEMRDVLTNIQDLLKKNVVRAISTLENKTVENNLVEMALGNNIGFTMDTEYSEKIYPMGFLVEVPRDFETNHIVVANTNDTTNVVIDKEYSLDELRDAYVSPLKEVYSQVAINATDYAKPVERAEFKSDKKVLIPVVTGVRGEYDLYKSFRKYTDNVDYFVIKEDLDFEASIKEFGEILENYDVLALPDGPIFGNHPTVGKGLELILSHPAVKDKINSFVKDKKILAIGSSGVGVISTGLIEFGEIKDGTDIKIVSNPENIYISEVIESEVLDNRFSDQKYYTTAVGSDSLILDLDEEKYKDQIVSKFTDFFDGEIGVDGITDPSGNILVTISNFERFDFDGLKNVNVVEADFIEKLLK